LLFVILIVINCLWLHIDFYQLFLRLFWLERKYLKSSVKIV
jgi:hypothetical protein